MCAPEIGPSMAMSTNRIAPVASVLPSKAIASFWGDRFWAMIPEPITQAKRKKEPVASAAMRRARSGVRSRLRSANDRLRFGDGAQAGADFRFVDRVERKREEFAYAALQLPEGAQECVALPGTLDRGWIGNAPVHGERLARPDRADLAGGIVADGDDEVDRRRAFRGELVPAFRPQALGGKAELIEQGERCRVDFALGMAAGGKGAEAAAAVAVEDRLGEDRAGRVAGAEEEDVVGFHGTPAATVAPDL